MTAANPILKVSAIVIALGCASVALVSGGAAGPALVVVAGLVAVCIHTSNKGERNPYAGTHTLVLESCKILSAEEHRGGCDAEVEYRSVKVKAGGWGASNRAVGVSGSRKVALYISGGGVRSEWRSKLDNMTIRDLTVAELRGAVSMMTDEGDVEISVEIGRDLTRGVVLESVRVENASSALYTYRTRSHFSDEVVRNSTAR